jgi:chemotaxis protein MotB
MKKQSTLIIKKVKKNGHGGAHGGSWKVAYADFVTAMMAFFLLLWLITMVSPEKRAKVAAYFKYFSVYSQSGSSFMGESSQIFNEAGESDHKAIRDAKADSVNEMGKEVKEGIMSRLKDARDQVMVDTIENGVRIQIIDKDGSLMFEKGSSRMTPKAREILHVISDNIKNLPNSIVIEGHTDSLQYAGSGYSNWELSTERASSARKELESNGLQPQKIERVSGFADKEPLIAENPSDPRNRRISIILRAPNTNIYPAAITADKNTGTDREAVSHNEPVDHGSRMVNKFEENLSLIRSGMNAAEKESKEKIAHKNSGDTAAGSLDSMKSENKNWGPVIKKDDWSPIIKDELKPIMKNASPDGSYDIKSAAKQEEHDSLKKAARPILDNIEIPAPKKEELPVTAVQHDNTFYSKKKKATPLAPDVKENEKDAPAKEVNKGPIVIKELTNPVISKDGLFK